MSSSTESDLESLINSIRRAYTNVESGFVRTNYAIFVVAPEVLDFDLNKHHMCYILDSSTEYDTAYANKSIYQLLAQFRFHITFEHLNEHLAYLSCKFNIRDGTDKHVNENLNCFINKCKKSSLIYKILNSFSLNFYQVII